MWKILTEFPRSRLMSSFDQEIDDRKPAEVSERSLEVCEGFCDSSMARNRAISVVGRDTVFEGRVTSRVYCSMLAATYHQSTKVPSR
eukprot:scaffold52503_cov35-Cyclotella_meneghiniana.AAC.1